MLYFQFRSLDAGDISKQLKIREDLKCKSFKWFMTNVAFDLEQYYPAVPPEPYAHGEVNDKKPFIFKPKKCWNIKTICFYKDPKRRIETLR